MKKRIIGLVFVFALFITITTIAKTYSLFESTTSRVVQNNVGKWIVKINNSDVTTKSFVVSNLTWTNNGYALDSKAVPGSSSYFDIVIDPKGTEESIKYEIIFDFSGITNPKITVNSVSELVNNSLVRTGEYSYTGVITLNEINQNITNQVRVSLSWINDETNNDEDSALGKEYNTQISIPITVNISQYLGENISPYVAG